MERIQANKLSMLPLVVISIVACFFPQVTICREPERILFPVQSNRTVNGEIKFNLKFNVDYSSNQSSAFKKLQNDWQSAVSSTPVVNLEMKQSGAIFVCAFVYLLKPSAVVKLGQYKNDTIILSCNSASAKSSEVTKIRKSETKWRYFLFGESLSEKGLHNSTVHITNCRNVNGTAIRFTVQFPFPVDAVNRNNLANVLVGIRDNGITIGGHHHEVIDEPLIENAASAMTPVTCFQCQNDQKCVPKSGSSSQECVVPEKFVYGFGPSKGDLKLEEHRKRFETVTVPDGFPFSSSTVKQVFINVNGLISINNPNTSSNLQTELVDIMPQVCSNWTDPQLNSSDVKFNVWYQAYWKTNITTSNQKSVFTKVNSDVEKFVNRTFDATFVLVVTYEEMPPENGSVTPSERVNFQTVLITDDSASYSMFMYWTPEIQRNEAIIRPFTINCIKETLTRNKYRPYTIVEKTELPVVWFKSFDTLPTKINPDLECRKWHDKNKPNKVTIIKQSESLPTCPCNVTSLDINWISENKTQNGFQCFLNSPSLLEFGMRCCYTSRGSYDPKYPNSGSFLLYHPLKNFKKYNKEDVIPKQQCCEQSQLCDLYYDVRPNISCTIFMHTTETVSHIPTGTSYQDKSCSEGQGCTQTVPMCSSIMESIYSLIIGVAVGVPLFSVFVVITALALYCNNKRRRASKGKPTERPEEENRSNALGEPERVTRAQLQSISPSIASVLSVDEVYAEIGDVPEYLEILNTPVHNQIQDTPLVTYNHGIPRDTATQPVVHSKRFPAWNKPHAPPVPARKISDPYLHPIPTIYERNGATDFKSDYLHPIPTVYERNGATDFKSD